MRKLAILLTVVVVAVSCTSEPEAKPPGFPLKVKILHDPAVTATETADSRSKAIGSAIANYEYEVTDAQVGNYKIRLPDGKVGWIAAKPEANWTKVEDGKVIILHSTISVRLKPADNKSERVGTVRKAYEYPLLATRYKRYRILLPDIQEGEKVTKEGWIYAGTPEDPWVVVTDRVGGNLEETASDEEPALEMMPVEEGAPDPEILTDSGEEEAPVPDEEPVEEPSGP